MRALAPGRRLVAALVLGAGFAASAAVAAEGAPPAGENSAGEARERAALVAARCDIDARFASEERACAARFAVTACVDAARMRRREDLSALGARQAALDDAQRERKAAQRRARIATKVERAGEADTAASAAPLLPLAASAARR